MHYTAREPMHTRSLVNANIHARACDHRAYMHTNTSAHVIGLAQVSQGTVARSLCSLAHAHAHAHAHCRQHAHAHAHEALDSVQPYCCCVHADRLLALHPVHAFVRLPRRRRKPGRKQKRKKVAKQQNQMAMTTPQVAAVLLRTRQQAVQQKHQSWTQQTRAKTKKTMTMTTTTTTKTMKGVLHENVWTL